MKDNQEKSKCCQSPKEHINCLCFEETCARAFCSKCHILFIPSLPEKECNHEYGTFMDDSKRCIKCDEKDRELRDKIARILVKHDMPTRQVAISELEALIISEIRKR